MMDDLARIIHDVIENDDDSGGGAYARAATAVRSWLLSEERVEAAAKASALADWPMSDWPGDFSGEEREKLRKSIRAALTAAIGEDG